MELEGSWLLSAVLGLLYQGLSKQTAQQYKIGGKYPDNLLPFLTGCSKVVKMNWKIKQKRYQRHPRRKKAAAGDGETPHTLIWNCTNSQKNIKIILGHLLFSCVSSLPDVPWMLRAKAAVGDPLPFPQSTPALHNTSQGTLPLPFGDQKQAKKRGRKGTQLGLRCCNDTGNSREQTQALGEKKWKPEAIQVYKPRRFSAAGALGCGDSSSGFTISLDLIRNNEIFNIF